MNGQYTSISACYDELRGTDYDVWAKYLDGLIKKHNTIKTSLVLDAACGTGGLTAKLAELGYDMTGVDISEDMLCIARGICPQGVLLLRQDISDFELYGTVDCIVCCLDSLNYLAPNDLLSFFNRAHNYLNNGGLLIFDVNTEYKFNEIYGGRDYILESADRTKLLAWSCDYSKQKKQCRFLLTLFSRNKNGSYTRADEEQREYYHSERFIREGLEANSFELLATYGELSYDEPSSEEQRIHYTARCCKS